MEKQCLECEEWISGRADKKFCSDGCRSSYNNRLNSDTQRYIRHINSILRKNRRILEELSRSGRQRKIHRDVLLRKGFSFDYFTSEIPTLDGGRYRYCYDQGYLELDGCYYCVGSVGVKAGVSALCAK